MAYLYDSSSDDTFVGMPDYATMYGDGFHNRVWSFDEVHAEAEAGGVDVARLYDSPGDDTFDAVPEHGTMYRTGEYYNRAKFFEGVHAYATAGGKDLAQLHGSADSDTFYAAPGESAMYIPGRYFNRAKFFEEVLADAIALYHGGLFTTLPDGSIDDGTEIEVEDAGAAYLFDGQTGELLQTYMSPARTENAQFGYSVAAIGNNVLVAARWDDTGAEGAGATYLFDGATGEILHVFTSPTPFVGEEFGFSVAALGNDALIGARWDNRWDDLGDGSGGAVYLFDGATGQLQQTVANPSPGAWDAFGISVAASNDQVIVGTQTGNVAYTFERIAESRTVLTDANGEYRFAELDAGTYRVLEDLPDGYVQTLPGGSGTYMVDVALSVEPPQGVLANDADPEGDELTVRKVNSPRHGTLTLLPDGSFTFTPDPDFHGSDSFTYRANDGQAESNVATVHVTVTINAPNSLRDNLRITEVNFHPYPPTPDERALGLTDREAFEFIELQNTRDMRLDISGAQFTEGVEFELLGVPLLAAGEYALLVKDRAAFEARYGPELNVVGEYRGDLHNSGERIMMRDPFDRTILDFQYDDGDRWDDSRWPRWADGFGSTLEVMDTNGDYNDGGNWQASAEYGGSPGRPGSGEVGSVVINEVLSHSNPPLTDSVELHNTLDYSIDVGGWHLSDSVNSLRAFRIPDGTIIPAGGYVVYDEQDFNFAFDSARGNHVWLTAADAEGNVTQFVDHVEFGAALADESFGRWPNGQGDLYPMRSLTLGSENSGPRVGPIVISEVMYQPPDPPEGVDPGELEFVEIFNPTAEEINLTDWQIRGGLRFDFAREAKLSPGEAIVVVGFNPSNGAALDAFHDFYLISAPVRIVGPYGGNLDGDGDTVRLMRPDYPPWWEPHHWPHVVEDTVTYDNEEPWPASADGGGDSLQRRAVDLWGLDPDSWAAAAPSPGFIDLMVGTLAITEINYHPHDPTPDELNVDPTFRSEDFEFIELLNIAGRPVDLTGMRFTQGVLFDFPETSLAPGERVLVVRNQAAFQARYGAGIDVLGEFSGALHDGTDRNTLISSDGQEILSFSYQDSAPWPQRADGQGSSLELINVHSSAGRGASWRASTQYGGSPGSAGVGPLDEVLINEVLVDGNDTASGGVELYNHAGGQIDVGGWYLSNSGSDPRKFRIPDSTVIEARGYVVFSGADLLSAPGGGLMFDGLHGDQVMLLKTDDTGKTTHFADHVQFGALRPGESLGRWPNGLGDFTPMISPTIDPEHPENGENSGPRVGPLVISELMYHPRETDDTIE